jgi:hypothetical protein
VVAKGGITISPNQVGNTIIGQMWDIDPIKDPGPYIVQFKALNRWWDGR